MKLESVLEYLDGYLQVRGHPDYPGALNGLQVEGGRDDIARVVAAVDASEASIAAAIGLDADLMLVHHGLFWGGTQRLTGRLMRRVRPLIEAGVSLWSCHLPLDAHPEVGNSALLARALGLELEGSFAAYQGADIGWHGRLPTAEPPEGLCGRAAASLGGPVRLLSGGPTRVERVGVVTGGGGSFTAEAARLGLHALVTGEASHHVYHDAKELGIHVLLGGHYATEVFGVRALAEHVAERFGLRSDFVDQPTGL